MQLFGSLCDFFSIHHSAKKVGIFRITLGSILLWNQLLLINHVIPFYSSEGYFTGSFLEGRTNSIIAGWLPSGDWSILYQLDSPPVALTLYYGHLLAIILFILGFQTQLMAGIVWFALLCLHKRYPFIATGEDTVPRVTMFFFIFINAGVAFVPKFLRSFKQPLKSAKITWPLTVIQLHIAIGYAFSALFKIIHSHQWANGSHNFAMMNFPLKSYHNLLWLVDYPVLITLLTYWVLFSEFSFVFLVWNPRTRLFAIANMILFHFGIFLTLDAFTFSPLMITTLLVFLSNSEHAIMRRWFYNIWQKKLFQKSTFTLIALIPISIFLTIRNDAAEHKQVKPINSFVKSMIHNQCPDGYISIPKDTLLGIEKDFCVMKFEAKQSDTNCSGQPCPVSKPDAAPWAGLNRPNAQERCASVGAHLITDKEWIAIARNISSTPINDVSRDYELQIATGHSDDSAEALISNQEAEPIVSGCDLSKPLWNDANQYQEKLCELRGNRSNDSKDPIAKGYFLTNGYWHPNEFYSGGSPSSQLRTHVLSNGEIIWDFAGNVWEWSDLVVIEPRTGGGNRHTEDSDGITGNEMPRPYDYKHWIKDTWADYSLIQDFRGLDYLKPLLPLSRVNGIGAIYINPGNTWSRSVPVNASSVHNAIRGGYWADKRGSGIFSLALTDDPSNVASDIGFRCVRN